ncbi:hypothetical protein OUZ56_011037 [Daphnia magna]|uniref:Uncharacterized protein n=1 Tax=Daphnia magna TaxID=35525 RepID=A0ABQ9YZ39_9CRUS|nr:hypothetical protein OUZ56_011037 [Daphnia magna]
MLTRSVSLLRICFRRHWYEVTGMKFLLSASLGFVLDVTGMKSLLSASLGFVLDVTGIPVAWFTSFIVTMLFETSCKQHRHTLCAIRQVNASVSTTHPIIKIGKFALYLSVRKSDNSKSSFQGCNCSGGFQGWVA